MLFGSRFLGGAVVLAASLIGSSGALAQSNPFLPSAGTSKADVEKIIDSKLGEMERRITSQIKSTKPDDAVAGPAGAPGVVGPLTPGAGAAGINYPGVVPGGAGVAPALIEPPKGPIEEARGSGVRFLGCINGAPKFVKNTGERVSFTKAQITQAIKDGVLPSCR